MAVNHYINTKTTINQLLEDNIIRIRKVDDNGFFINDKYDTIMYVSTNKDGFIHYLEIRGGINPLFFLYTLIKRYKSEIAFTSSLELIFQSTPLDEKVDYSKAYYEDTLAIVKFGEKTDFDFYYGYSETELNELEKKLIKEQESYYQIPSCKIDKVNNTKNLNNSCEGSYKVVEGETDQPSSF